MNEYGKYRKKNIWGEISPAIIAIIFFSQIKIIEYKIIDNLVSLEVVCEIVQAEGCPRKFQNAYAIPNEYEYFDIHIHTFYHRLGMLAVAEGKPELAIALYEKSELSISKLLLGFIYSDLGLESNAISVWREGRVERFFLLKGSNYFEESDFEEAIEELVLGLQINPDSDKYYYSLLSESYLQINQVDEAYLAWLKAFPNVNHESFKELYTLGVIKQKRGLYAEADKIFFDAVALYTGPSSQKASINVDIGNSYRELGQFETAEKWYARAEYFDQTMDTIIKVAYARGANLFFQKRYIEAEAVLLEGLKINPSSSQLHYLLGVVYSEQFDIESSLRQLEFALELEPQNGFYHFELSRLLDCLGDTSRADIERDLAGQFEDIEELKDKSLISFCSE